MHYFSWEVLHKPYSFSLNAFLFSAFIQVICQILWYFISEANLFLVHCPDSFRNLAYFILTIIIIYYLNFRNYNVGLKMDSNVRFVFIFIFLGSNYQIHLFFIWFIQIYGCLKDIRILKIRICWILICFYYKHFKI